MTVASEVFIPNEENYNKYSKEYQCKIAKIYII